ncbi:MAG: hypothetical protein KF888_10570 [Nitrosomonas sp.]|nr:hypothetical protein [Nitrosomonas sp.]
MNSDEICSYLIAGAAWQESLLQSYRSLHVTIQSILLAIGVALTVVPFTIMGYPVISPAILVSTVLLTCVGGLHFYSSNKFSGVVLARGEDINWWHTELIKAEHGISSSSRYFTKFKIHQQARRKNVSHLEAIFLAASSSAVLTEEQVGELIGKGLGHTRQVIDKQLFVWIGRIWWLLLLYAWGGVAIAFLK